MKDGLADLSAKVLRYFARSKMTFAAAESCTGGIAASGVVSVPRASVSFKGSAVCYCDEAKISILKVRRKTLDKFYAESPECAIEMADGARKIFGADAAFSTTGFIDSNTGGKPAEFGNTAYVGVSFNGAEAAFEIKFDPLAERDKKRSLVSYCALEIFLEFVKSK